MEFVQTPERSTILYNEFLKKWVLNNTIGKQQTLYRNSCSFIFFKKSYLVLRTYVVPNWSFFSRFLIVFLVDFGSSFVHFSVVFRSVLGRFSIFFLFDFRSVIRRFCPFSSTFRRFLFVLKIFLVLFH